MKRSWIVLLVVAALAFLAFKILSPKTPPAPRPPSSSFAEAKAQDILAEVKKSKFTLVNIWASWCEPCREEFPVLVELRKKYLERGIQFLFISADFATQTDDALVFLKNHGVDFKTYHKSEDDAGFINTLYPQWTGAIPATLIFDQTGRLLKAWQGAASKDEFESTLHEVLGLREK
jgi:thiol-disulfide isomerase/thioredoxin